MTIYRKSAFINPVEILLDYSSPNSIEITNSEKTAGNLKLSGNLVNLQNRVEFGNFGYSSAISIGFNTVDLSAYSFTICGEFNGKIIAETLVGPVVNEVVTTDKFFTVVTNISINGPSLDNLAIGFLIAGNTSIVMFLENGNTVKNLGHNNYRYKVLLRGKENGEIPILNLPIYGVAAYDFSILQRSGLEFDNIPNNYFLIPETSTVPSGIYNSDEFTAGMLFETPVQYKAVIVYVAYGMLNKELFIEISQS